MCSLYGGLSLANAKLGAIHGFAGVLGGIISTPHGAICAALLAACIRINVAALRAREPTNPALAKYEQAARLVCQDEKATVADLITWVDETCQICNIEPLVVPTELIDTVITKSAGSSSMKGNPIKLTTEELTSMLQQSSA